MEDAFVQLFVALCGVAFVSVVAVVAGAVELVVDQAAGSESATGCDVQTPVQGRNS